MKKFFRIFLLLLIVSLIVSGVYSTGRASDMVRKDDPMIHGWSVVDLFVARPLGVVAGIGGSVLFVAALPFTIPSGSVGDTASMFIVQPFQFSFIREVPDPDL